MCDVTKGQILHELVIPGKSKIFGIFSTVMYIYSLWFPGNIISRRVTAAENHSGGHFCRLRAGNWGDRFYQPLTILCGLMTFDFSNKTTW